MNTHNLPPASGYSDQPQGEVCPPVQTGGAASSASGIYYIQFAPSPKIYIGQSTDLPKRKRAHLCMLRTNTHHNPHLQAAFNLYGESSFRFGVLDPVNASDMDANERYWIWHFQSADRRHGYNLDYGGQAEKRRSLETRKKIAALQTGRPLSDRHRASIARAKTGTMLSQEHRERIGRAHKGKKRSRDAVARMSAAQSRRQAIARTQKGKAE